MRQTTVTLAAGVALALCLLALAPARLMLSLLPEVLSLQGVSGSVWSGDAARARVRISGKVFELGRLSWQIRPLSILGLAPSVDVQSRWGRQRIDGTVGVSLSGVLFVRDLNASLDVRFSRELLPLFVGGRVALEIEEAELSSGAVDAFIGRVTWQDAVWAARAGDVALGNYVLDVGTDERGIIGRVLTLSGPLAADGEVLLSADQWRVELDLSGPATDNEGLRRSLDLLATPTSDGFEIVLSGKI